MSRENLVGIIERIGARAPGMANLTRAVLQKMLRVAFDRGQIRTNPVSYTHLDVYKRQGPKPTFVQCS